MVTMLVVAIFYILRRLMQKNDGSRFARILHELIPELVGDFKVFIGLYQVLCSMGCTMEITYPAIMESFIGAVRSFANFDVFAMPGLSCVMGSSVIGKFWLSALLPPAIAILYGVNFLLQVRRSRVENKLDDTWDAAIWEEVKSGIADDHTHEYSHEDQAWTKQVKQLFSTTDKDD